MRGLLQQDIMFTGEPSVLPLQQYLNKMVSSRLLVHNSVWLPIHLYKMTCSLSHVNTISMIFKLNLHIYTSLIKKAKCSELSQNQHISEYQCSVLGLINLQDIIHRGGCELLENILIPTAFLLTVIIVKANSFSNKNDISQQCVGVVTNNFSNTKIIWCLVHDSVFSVTADILSSCRKITIYL